MSTAIRIWMDGAGRLVLLRELREAFKELCGDGEVTFYSRPNKRCIVIHKATASDPIRARVTRCGMNTAPRLQLPVDMIRECQPGTECLTQRHVHVTLESSVDPAGTHFYVWF